jgi:hypothetical protein
LGDGAWIEALAHKKPRRLIHNQLLIQTCLMLAFMAPFPLAGVSFWLVFGVYPVVAVPAVLIAWLVLLVSYATLKSRNLRQSG